MPRRRVEVTTRDGVVLEGAVGALAEAEGAGERGRLGVLITHPHPKLGGDMYNNVVTAVARALTEAGFTTMTLNFRGVGRSKGSSSWQGTNERKDVEAALEFLRAETGVENVALVGYSFGAAIGLGADAKDLRGYVAISYPYGRAASCALSSHFRRADNSLPKLFLIGDKDQFANVQGLKAFASGLEVPGEVKVFDDVDHFWQGRESDLVGPVKTFLDSLL
ncbi:Protein ABHD12B [Hondaea fermentalgiana]|uniref:Protein ABHD12B n=1 Tax=Hondaea fermentalgiana TaxID=2315210 RepID=A0A2R5GBU1_9STRA|nr:Protein ABHD12B [Hondaea fermentalgiana]|eukprot:GBG28452.1 Protein ABHD12B [Hondaea fermentalgiana]